MSSQSRKPLSKPSEMPYRITVENNPDYTGEPLPEGMRLDAPVVLNSTGMLLLAKTEETKRGFTSSASVVRVSIVEIASMLSNLDKIDEILHATMLKRVLEDAFGFSGSTTLPYEVQKDKTITAIEAILERMRKS